MRIIVRHGRLRAGLDCLPGRVPADASTSLNGLLMTTLQRNTILLTLFAIAMAHVEASLVVHLRSLYYPGNPQTLFPLVILSHRDLAIELARELATVVMIGTVALLAARGATRVFAAFTYVFGLWDLCYYLWLKQMIGWPVSWAEWDVLFLIPWPWLAPWITAALIAVLFCLWGGWVLLAAPDARLRRSDITLFVAGSLLALAAFLGPAFPLLAGGEVDFRGFRPTDFNGLLYLAGYLLMAVGLWRGIEKRR